MRYRLFYTLSLFAGLLLAGSAAQAQTLYRCGNTYQDKPCQGESGKVVVEGAAAASASAPPRVVDDFCKQQAQSAAQLRWEKEGGRTVDEQVLRDPPNAGFIRYVYAKRGSALDVRRLVERDCMDTGERKQQSGPSATPGAGGFVMAQPRSAVQPSAASAQPEVPRRGGGIGHETASSSGNGSGNRNIDESFCRSLFDRERRLIEQQKLLAGKPIPEEVTRQLRESADTRKAANCPAAPF